MAATESEKSGKYPELKSALDGLSYQSESDYPLDFVCWEKQPGKGMEPNFVCEQLGKEQDAKIEEADAQSFLEDCSKIETWHSEEEKKNAQGFKTLQGLLNQHLKNLKQFRVGEIQVTIVVVGEDEKNIVGFKTISIET